MQHKNLLIAHEYNTFQERKNEQRKSKFLVLQILQLMVQQVILLAVRLSLDSNHEQSENKHGCSD